MRFLSLLFFTFSLVFSVNLTPEQLQFAKNAGYSDSDIQKALNNQNDSTKNIKPKEQIVENEIIDDNSLTNQEKLKIMSTKDDKIPNLFSDSNKSNIKQNNTLIDEQKNLERYASLFFNNKNTLNPYSVPTPLNYNLNFGDKLSLKVYGSSNQEFNLSVDNSGNIIIPKVGKLQVIGLTFNEAKSLIIEESKKAYPNSTNILVDILEYASIQVTISGFVNAPGLYNLSSFSSIKDALLLSGGILDNGSYRNIYLKRDGKIYKKFDLYELVRYGNTNSDVILKNGDVLLVKPIGKEIILSGDVNYNASFELKNNETFKDLINYAAGFKPKANQNAIKLKRYENSTLKVFTLNKDKLFKMKPKSGDEVHIYSTSTVGAKLVEIKGNVVAPGEKELPKDKKLLTLLQKELKHFGNKSYFKNDTNYNYAIVKTDNKVKSFNLQKVLEKKENLILSAGDEIIIYKNDEFQEKPYVFAEGEVVNKKKQKYEFYEGMRAKDLFDIVLFKSDKIIEIENEKNNEENQERISLKIDKTKVQISRIENNEKVIYLVKGKDLDSFMLKKFDDIEFFEFSQVNNINTATIKGEVFIPGTYNIAKNTRLKDMINLVGGFTKKVLYAKFEIARYNIVNDERQRNILSLNLNKALKSNILIHPDDEITIFSIANWKETKYVELLGLVRFPGKYPIAEGEKLSSVIKRAGGFLDQAFISGAVFTREEIRILQQKRLDESMDKLKSKVLRLNLDANASKSQNSKKETAGLLSTLQHLEKESDTNRPIGRISLHLNKDLSKFENTPYNISLKDKDKLYIPSVNDTISVVGEVLNQNAFIYNEELNISDYLKKAGGLTSEADDDSIFVVRANGEAQRYENNSFFFENSQKIFKGDTIIVPVNVDPISDISFMKDISQIVYQLAVTAASIKTVGGL